jgi:GNAT superfamily N-acetyltransferase
VARFLVRRATTKDLDVLVEHRKRMWEDMGEVDQSTPEADRVYKRWARTRLKSGRFVGFVVETPKGDVAGTGCVWIMDTQPNPWNPEGKTPYLLSMYTRPEHRGQGVATRIVEEAIAFCKKRGFHVMRLHASEQGRSVYAKLGFERSWEMRLDWSARQRHTAKRKAYAPSQKNRC